MTIRNPSHLCLSKRDIVADKCWHNLFIPNRYSSLSFSTKGSLLKFIKR